MMSEANAKIRAGFLCYDLSPASAGSLNRLQKSLSEEIELIAYPLLDTVPTTPITFKFRPSSTKGKFFTFNNLSGNAPESMSFNIPVSMIIDLVRNSDVVCFLGIQGITAFITSLFVKLFKKPSVAISQTMGFEIEKNRLSLIRLTKGYVLRTATVNVAQTPATVETLEKVYRIPKDKIVMAPWDAAAEDFFPVLEKFRKVPVNDIRDSLHINASSFMVLFVGSLIYLKGVDILIKAFSLLQEKSPNCVLHLVGPDGGVGGQKKKLEDLARERNIYDKVVFWDKQDWDVLAQLYLAADVFVLPTRRDMWPKVLVEAAMAGLPIITTPACGSAGYIVQDGINGFIVPIDGIEEMSKKLETLQNCDIKEGMGKASFSIYPNYTQVGEKEVEGLYKAIKLAIESTGKKFCN